MPIFTFSKRIAGKVAILAADKTCQRQRCQDTNFTAAAAACRLRRYFFSMICAGRFCGHTAIQSAHTIAGSCHNDSDDAALHFCCSRDIFFAIFAHIGAASFMPQFRRDAHTPERVRNLFGIGEHMLRLFYADFAFLHILLYFLYIAAR